jgi:adenylate cyclase
VPVDVPPAGAGPLVEAARAGGAAGPSGPGGAAGPSGAAAPTEPNEADLLTLVQSLGSAIALAEAETWVIRFENARFFRWFATEGAEVESLSTRLPDFNPDRAASRLASRGSYDFETATREGQRELPVRVRLQNLEPGTVLVECWDVSKEKETQYMLDSYSRMAENNARELGREKERVERLLLNIMPRAVLEELKDYGTVTPQRFDDATILMLDFVGFTDMAISQDPSRIITELNDIFSVFDRLVDGQNCERLKTIGDAYLAVAGVPEPAPDHAHSIARVALRMRRYLERRNAAHPEEWVARIGISTGPVIGSLVGIQKYVYDLFGPGINLAERMEAASEPMRITCCERTYELLRNDFLFTDRGPTEIKGFGTQQLYFLEDELRDRY